MILKKEIKFYRVALYCDDMNCRGDYFTYNAIEMKEVDAPDLNAQAKHKYVCPRCGSETVVSKHYPYEERMIVKGFSR